MGGPFWVKNKKSQTEEKPTGQANQCLPKGCCLLHNFVIFFISDCFLFCFVFFHRVIPFFGGSVHLNSAVKRM